MTRSPAQTVGLWGLDSPEALFGKLTRDLARMRAAPRDPDPAFDFFVTAYHMHEWVAQGDKALAKTLETDDLILSAGHIATRGKHFSAQAKKWVQLQSTENKAPGPLSVTPAAMPTALRVVLSEPSLTPLDKTDITAIALAECLLKHWQDILNGRRSTP